MPKQTTSTFRGGDGSAANVRCAIILVTGVRLGHSVAVHEQRLLHPMTVGRHRGRAVAHHDGVGKLCLIVLREQADDDGSEDEARCTSHLARPLSHKYKADEPWQG